MAAGVSNQMEYTVEQWHERGVSSARASTKRQANRIAEAMRGDPRVVQTIVIFPTGSRRICRNVGAKAGKS